MTMNEQKTDRKDSAGQNNNYNLGSKLTLYYSLQNHRASRSSVSTSLSFRSFLVFVPRFHQPFRSLSTVRSRGVLFKYPCFRSAGRRLYLSNFCVVIQLSAGRSHAASGRPASSVSLSFPPSTCPAPSFLSVF
jgi:hypothetical protein